MQNGFINGKSGNISGKCHIIIKPVQGSLILFQPNPKLLVEIDHFFYGHSLYLADAGSAVLSYKRKYVHLVLIKC